MYRTTVSGTLVGCGSAPVYIAADSPIFGSITAGCGTWTATIPTVFEATIECAPTATVPDGTQWQAQGLFAPPSGTTVFEMSVTITLGVAAGPVLASATLSCPPYP
jgi:hypothetical protein